jgi:hypothetical protein
MAFCKGLSVNGREGTLGNSNERDGKDLLQRSPCPEPSEQ